MTKWNGKVCLPLGSWKEDELVLEDVMNKTTSEKESHVAGSDVMQMVV